MLFFLFKIIISGVVIAIVSSLGNKNPVAGGLITGAPVVSSLVLLFVHADANANAEQVAKLSKYIGIMVIPGVIHLFVISALLRRQVPFPKAMMMSLSLWLALDVVFFSILRRLEL